MKFSLTSRQWAWYLALIFWVVAFIFSPVLPEGKIAEIVRNMQLIAAVVVAALFGSPRVEEEDESK